VNARVALIKLGRYIGDRICLDLLDALRLIEALKRARDMDKNAQVTLPIETE
jgi:hypothetical protein